MDCNFRTTMHAHCNPVGKTPLEIKNSANVPETYLPACGPERPYQHCMSTLKKEAEVSCETSWL